MILAQNSKFRLINIFIVFSLSSITGAHLCNAQQPDNQITGVLKLEGKYIERLILSRQDNNEREEFRRPEQIIKLPTGKYYLHEVHLQGGYICYASKDLTRPQANITQDETAILKIGSPLKQIIHISRQGRNLKMNYELIGVGGEKYISGDRSKQATFTIYKREKEIASDKFKYG